MRLAIWSDRHDRVLCIVQYLWCGHVWAGPMSGWSLPDFDWSGNDREAVRSLECPKAKPNRLVIDHSLFFERTEVCTVVKS
jgi:hypothetical protein